MPPDMLLILVNKYGVLTRWYVEVKKNYVVGITDDHKFGQQIYIFDRVQE